MRMTPHDDTVEEHVQSSGIFVRESMPNVLSRRVWLKKKTEHFTTLYVLFFVRNLK